MPNPSQLVNVDLTERTSDWTPPTITFGEDLTLALRFTIQNNGTAIDPGMTLTGLKASVGNVDARPAGGSTCLFIGGPNPTVGNTTGAIQWNDTATTVAARINALAGVTATYGTAHVVGGGGSFLIFFGTRSQQVPICATNNILWPVSFVRVSAWQNGNEWVHQVRFTQAPVAFTSSEDVVLPPAPTVTEVQAGGSSDGVKWNEIQAVYIPPNFLGSYVLTMGGARSGLLSVADDPTTMTAALSVLGDGFNVTNPLLNTANVEFIDTLGGAPQALLGVTVISAPPGDPTITIQFDRAELLILLQQQNPATVPLEVWIETVDSTTGKTGLLTAFTAAVTVKLPLTFPDLEDTPTIDWLRASSPVSYTPFGLNNVLTGQQFYTTEVGDGESTTFDITHGLNTKAVWVWVQDAAGNQLADKTDFSARINSANDVVVTCLGAAPATGTWTIYVVSAQAQAVWANGLTVTIGQVTGLATELAGFAATIAALQALMPTTPPSVSGSGSSNVVISIPASAGYVPFNTLGSNGKVKARALLPAQFTAVSGVGAGTFPLGAVAGAGTVVQNQTGVVQIVPASMGIDEMCVPANGYVASDGRLWYVVNQAGSTNSFFPAAFERTLFSFEVNSAMLTPGSTLQLTFSLALQLLSANTRAQYMIVLETGSVPEDASPSPVALNLQNVVWSTATPVLAQQVILSDVLVTHGFGLSVSLNAAGNALTAQRNLYGTWTAGAPAPASANFAVRARLIQFDVEDSVLRPKGVVSYSLSNAIATIAL